MPISALHLVSWGRGWDMGKGDGLQFSVYTQASLASSLLQLFVLRVTLAQNIYKSVFNSWFAHLLPPLYISFLKVL